MPHYRKYPEIKVGDKYGRLTVLAPADPSIQGNHTYWCWLVRCDCGTEKVVKDAALKNGATKSCGCLRKDVGIQARVWATRHGEGANGKETPEYISWTGMMKRCYSPSLHNFRYWGGRGIKVCVRWHRYENFLADMGRKPSPKHSIDRIDNGGNYEPTNCRWATAKEQQNNKRPKGSVKVAA